mmetsp:Transcript_62972/g.150164  ORF Transcript_62972/g.150164 Transcript_62972/m.150164 type:complete len:621 (+) Transcript_62972:115-1977(+)
MGRSQSPSRRSAGSRRRGSKSPARVRGLGSRGSIKGIQSMHVYSEAGSSYGGSTVAQSNVGDEDNEETAYHLQGYNHYEENVDDDRPRSPTGTSVPASKSRRSREALATGHTHHTSVIPKPHVHPGDQDDFSSDEEWEEPGLGGMLKSGLNFFQGPRGVVDDQALPTKQDARFKNAVLAKLFTHSAGVEVLDLAEAGYMDADMPRLAEALAQNKRVKHLTLATNAITETGCHALAEGLAQNNSLTYLDLGENQLLCGGALAVARMVAQKPKLIGLDLASNRISDTGCVAVCRALGQTPGVPIQVLNLAENALSDEAAVAVAHLMHKADHLHHLDLSRSNFGGRAVQALGDRILVSKSLRHLSMANVPLHDSAAEALMRSVAKNSTLHNLDLYGCSLGETGATQVAAAIGVNRVLKRLDIGANKISSAGLALLSDSITANTALQTLRLWGNNFQGFGMDRLLSTLYKNDHLTDLDLTGCGADPALSKLVHALVNKNKQTVDASEHEKKYIAKAHQEVEDLQKEVRKLKRKIKKMEFTPILAVEDVVHALPFGLGGIGHTKSGAPDADEYDDEDRAPSLDSDPPEANSWMPPKIPGFEGLSGWGFSGGDTSGGLPQTLASRS